MIGEEKDEEIEGMRVGWSEEVEEGGEGEEGRPRDPKPVV